MTKHQAHAKATELWGTRGTTPGDRVGCVSIRRKNVTDRFEVGYYVRGGRRDDGVYVHSNPVVMGKGPTWEIAFERAANPQLHLESVGAVSAAIVLAPDVVTAIEKYITTDWASCDPSKIGALNAVAYIGERVVALYQERKSQ